MEKESFNRLVLREYKFHRQALHLASQLSTSRPRVVS